MSIVRNLLSVLLIFISFCAICQENKFTNLDYIWQFQRNGDSFLIHSIDFRNGRSNKTAKLTKTNNELETLWELTFDTYFDNTIRIFYHDSNRIYLQLIENELHTTSHYIVEVNWSGDILHKTLIIKGNVNKGPSWNTKKFRNKFVYGR